MWAVNFDKAVGGGQVTEKKVCKSMEQLIVMYLL